MGLQAVSDDLEGLRRRFDRVVDDLLRLYVVIGAIIAPAMHQLGVDG